MTLELSDIDRLRVRFVASGLDECYWRILRRIFGLSGLDYAVLTLKGWTE